MEEADADLLRDMVRAHERLGEDLFDNPKDVAVGRSSSRNFEIGPKPASQRLVELFDPTLG